MKKGFFRIRPSGTIESLISCASGVPLGRGAVSLLSRQSIDRRANVWRPYGIVSENHFLKNQARNVSLAAKLIIAAQNKTQKDCEIGFSCAVVHGRDWQIRAGTTRINRFALKDEFFQLRHSAKQHLKIQAKGFDDPDKRNIDVAGRLLFSIRAAN